MEGVYVKTEPEPIPHASTSEPPVPLAVPLEAQPCRLCANIPDRAIEIYSTEGLSNQLSDRINEYLPVKVSPDDKLPLCCCWTCVTTLLSFHELVVACVEAEKRLQIIEPPKPILVPALPDPEPDIVEFNDDDAEMMDADDGEGDIDGDDDYEPENEDDDEESEEETKPIPGTSDDTECLEIGETVITKQEHVMTKQEHADEKQHVDETETSNVKRSKGKAFRDTIAEIKQRCREDVDNGEVMYRCDICDTVDEQFFTFIEHYLDVHVTAERQKASGGGKRKRKAKLKDIVTKTEEQSGNIASKAKEQSGKEKAKKQKKEKSLLKRRNASESKAIAKLCKFTGDDGKTLFKCFICERIITWWTFMLNHVRQHKDFKKALEDNGEEYKKRNEAIKQRSTYVDNKGQTYYKCEVCETRFEEDHIVAHHHHHFLGQGDEFTLMENEIKTRCKRVPLYNGVHYYQCEFCRKLLPSVEGVIRHFRSHKSLAPFSCTTCDFNFMYKCELENHQARIHGTEIVSAPAAPVVEDVIIIN